MDVARDHPTLLAEQLERWAATIGRERIRLALPPLTRKWEETNVRHKVARLLAAGWTKWEAANLSAWPHLGLDPSRPETGEIDLSTDWSVYVVNRAAALRLEAMGVTPIRAVAGGRPGEPASAAGGIRTAGGGDRPPGHAAVPGGVVRYANLIGGCPGKANCSFESMEMTSSHGERVTALDYHCRTIVLNQGPFCLSTRLKDLAAAGAVSLRADFVYRKYEPGACGRCGGRCGRAGRWRAAMRRISIAGCCDSPGTSAARVFFLDNDSAPDEIGVAVRCPALRPSGPVVGQPTRAPRSGRRPGPARPRPRGDGGWINEASRLLLSRGPRRGRGRAAGGRPAAGPRRRSAGQPRPPRRRGPRQERPHLQDDADAPAHAGRQGARRGQQIGNAEAVQGRPRERRRQVDLHRRGRRRQERRRRPRPARAG